MELQQESIRAAMDQAWRDHHHARDQTWRALQVEAVLAGGMIAAEAQAPGTQLVVGAATLVLAATAFGILISLHHRNSVEVLKLTHIQNCQSALGLSVPHLISGTKRPKPVRLWYVFVPWKNNTALFILRMHVVIAAFATLYVQVLHSGPASSMLLRVSAMSLAASLLTSIARTVRDKRRGQLAA